MHFYPIFSRKYRRQNLGFLQTYFNGFFEVKIPYFLKGQIKMNFGFLESFFKYSYFSHFTRKYLRQNIGFFAHIFWRFLRGKNLSFKKKQNKAELLIFGEPFQISSESKTKTCILKRIFPRIGGKILVFLRKIFKTLFF